MTKYKGLKRAVVKEELVALTNDLEKAILLNQFIYWSQRVYDFDKFIDEERERAANEDIKVVIDNQNGWIYKDMDELKEEVMFTSSIPTMSRKLNDLVKSEWLERRRNPKYKWDKRYQYRVNLNKISKDLFDLGYILQDYKINIVGLLKCSNLQNESTDLQDGEMAKNSNFQNENTYFQNENTYFQNERAISETTTETTLDITSFNHSPKLSTETKENERMNELKQILNNLNLEDFGDYAGSVLDALRILYYSDEPLQINGIKIPCNEVREDLRQVKWKHIDLAIRSLQIASMDREIGSIPAYLSRCIYNSIFNSSLKLEAEINFNNSI